MTINNLHLTFDKKKNVSGQVSSVKCRNGVSLVELLIGMSIVGFMGVLIAALYFSHFKLFSSQNTRIEVASENKIALEEMTNQIRESQGVAANCCSPTETTSADVLVLQIWPLNASGDPQEPNPSPTPQYDYIVYKKVADTLKKTIVPAAGSTRPSSDKIIASKINALAFTFDNADVTQAAQVTINLMTQNTVNNVTQTDTKTSTAVIRNK